MLPSGSYSRAVSLSPVLPSIMLSGGMDDTLDSLCAYSSEPGERALDKSLTLLSTSTSTGGRAETLLSDE